jgi:hypothetical protein
MGAQYDRSLKELAELAGQRDKPWVVWCSPAAAQTDEPEQLALLEYVEQMYSKQKTFLNGNVPVSKLKEEVRTLLNPDPNAIPDVGGKRRVYLIYKSGDRGEATRAGQIMMKFDPEFHFDRPNDPAKHTARLMGSDGVLLLWGSADEEWASGEFAAMVQAAHMARAKGLCVYDPRESKIKVLEQIREGVAGVQIAEQFGGFDPARLDSFFGLLRRAATAERS